MSPIDYILDLLYPPKCPFCMSLLKEAENGVCGNCINKLPCVKDTDRIQHFKNIKACTAPFYYEDAVRESILRYKFGGKSAYGRVYADFIRKAIDENGISCDIITWVPLSRRRYRKRGYDQAKIIAECIAKEKNLECARLLKKIRNNPAQSGTKTAAARKANVAGVYAPYAADKIKNKRILIVDDVVTTGSTLSECAGVLMACGAESVYAAAVARHKD